MRNTTFIIITTALLYLLADIDYTEAALYHLTLGCAIGFWLLYTFRRYKND